MTISRFQVMAVLQAARAKTLGLPDDSAYSWGLNRAIFYAAAKRGFRGGSTRGEKSVAGQQKAGGEKVEPDEFYLGDEKAFVGPSSKKSEPVFEIGSEPQTAKDFEKQVASRFGTGFNEAWSEALDIVKKYDPDTLKSQHDFFEQVYKPRRDVPSKKWTEEFTGKKKV
jgi:hypothetical protein